MPTATESPYLYSASYKQRSGQAVNVASHGGPLVVCNTNAKVANTTSGHLDPYAIVAEAGGNHANVRILEVPQIYSHLELFLAYRGTDAIASHRAIAVGLPPAPHRNKGILPNDVDSAFTDRDNLWIPLPVVAGTESFPSGDAEIFFTGLDDPGAVVDDGAVWRLIGSVTVFLSGVRQVMVLNSLAETSSTAAMILGRFTS